MRDLAQQSSFSRPKAPRLPVGGSTLKIIALLVIVLGSLFLIKAKISSGGGIIGGSSSQFKDAPHGLTPVELGQNAVSQGSSVNINVQSATLKDVKYGGQAKANATRKYGGGSLTLTVNATLPNPDGDRYQVWLSDGSQLKDAGFLSGSGGSWSLIFNDSDKYASYDTIWVTREITTEDEKPETHVLEGSF